MKKMLKILCFMLVAVLANSVFSSEVDELRKSVAVRQHPSCAEVLGNLDMLVKGGVPEGMNGFLKKRYAQLQEKIRPAAFGSTWQGLNELYSGLSQDLQTSLMRLSVQLNTLYALRINLTDCRKVITGRSFTGGVGVQDSALVSSP
jgi:hypothetical protein